MTVELKSKIYLNKVDKIYVLHVLTNNKYFTWKQFPRSTMSLEVINPSKTKDYIYKIIA
jgi:hypothetical protein